MVQRIAGWTGESMRRPVVPSDPQAGHDPLLPDKIAGDGRNFIRTDTIDPYNRFER